MDKSAYPNTHMCGERIRNALLSVEPNSTAKSVARKADVPVRTVERWLDMSSTPSLEHFSRLVGAYPSLVLVLLPVAPWLEVAITYLEQSKLEQQLAAMPAKRQRAVAALRGRR